MAGFDPDSLLDSIGVPQAPSFDPDALLDSIGVPKGPKRSRPATLAALDDDGPNSTPPMDRPGDPDYSPPRQHRDMSQLGAGLRAAGAAPATTPAPENSPLYDALGIDVLKDTLTGAGTSGLNTLKALPQKFNQGTSDAEMSLGRLASQTGVALDAAADKPVFAGPTLPGAQQGILAPLYHGLAGPLQSLGGEVEGIGGRQAEAADATLKGNPEADSILSRTIQGVPMLTGLAATGGLAATPEALAVAGPRIAATLATGSTLPTLGMGVLGAGGGLKQAEDAGATPGQAWTAAALQGGSDALLGQIGSVPLVGNLLHGVPVESATDAALALLKQGGMGATQAVAMDLAHAGARRATYAPDFGLSVPDLAKNAASQALLQGGLEAPGIELAGHEEAPLASEKDTSGTPQGALKVPSAPPVTPFSGTWPDFLASKEMDRSDFAVQTAGAKKALRAEYDTALDAFRDQAAAARAAAVPPRVGIMDQPEPALPLTSSPRDAGSLDTPSSSSNAAPVHPAVEAAVEAAIGPTMPPEIGAATPSPSDASGEISAKPAANIQENIPAPAPSAFPSEVYNRLVQGKSLRLAQTDLERDVGQTAKGLWPTGLLRSPADVQLLHDTLAGGGNLDDAVAALAKKGPQKTERFLPEPEPSWVSETGDRLYYPEPGARPAQPLAEAGAASRPLAVAPLAGPAEARVLTFQKAEPTPPVQAPPAGWGATEPDIVSRATPLAGPKGPPLPLPELQGVDSSQVQDAWNVASARYPGIARQITRIESAPPGSLPGEAMGERPLAAYRPGGVLRIPEGSTLDPGTLFHELTHAAQDARGQLAPPGGLSPAAFNRVEQFARARGEAARRELPVLVADNLAATVPPEHVASFVPGDSGAVESPTNATATRETLTGLPAVHPASAEGVEGTRGWLLGSALGDQELAQRVVGSGDRRLAGLADPIASVAPSLADAPPELRGYLRQAVDAYAATREGGAGSDYLVTGVSAEELARADADKTGDYVPKESKLGSISALSEREATEQLRARIASGEFPRDARLAQGTERAGSGGPEVSRLGRLLGADAPEEVHRIASFLSENGQHPESVAQFLHRVVELHQQSGGATGGEGQLNLSQLLEMAADRDQRQAAGSVIPLESSNPISKGVIYSPGERGSIDLRGPRFGEAAPIRRWFTREGKFAAMGADFAAQTKEWVNEKDFRVRATEKKIVANVRDYGTALRNQMEALKHADVAPPGSPIGPDSTIEDVHRYVRAGIMGENDLSAVSPALQDAAGALRSHLTDQSRAYLQRPDLPASLKAVISDNLDSYFPRTFERITDPKSYAKKIKRDFDAARDAGVPRGQSWKISEAADWAQREHPDWSREDAEGYAFKLLNDDPQAAYAIARGTAPQKGGMGTESRGNLKARLNLPLELDNLLGLHQDPTRSYQIAAMRAARDLATYDLHSKVARMGSVDPTRPDGLTPDGQRPIFTDRPTPDTPVLIGGKGPLAGKYASEQVAASIRGMSTISPQHAGFQRLYYLWNGSVKTGKIVLNTPMGPARNMITWPSILLAGGHFVDAFPAKYAYESMKALPLAIEANLGAREGAVLKFAKTLAYSLPLANGETVGDHLFPTGQKLADLRAQVQRKTELGVLGQSTATDDLRYYTGQTEEPTAGQRFQKVLRDTGGIWSGEHDMGKDIVFSAEEADLRKANPDLSQDEIDRWAAERTLKTTPSRSEVSEGVKALRANPLASPSPTFAAERFRNLKNGAMIAWEDLNSTNPQMKILGAKRAAGLLTALTLAGGGASTALQWLWNTTKEDADALREFLPDHFKDHQIAVSDRQGGKMRYADISPLMPATGVTDPAMALLRGIHQGSTRDGMIDAAQEFARPFLDEEFALKTGVDLLANQQRDGNLFDSATDLAREHSRDIQRRQIYLPGAPGRVVAGQIGKYLWHQDGPGIGLEAERFARANDLLPNTNSRGKRYTNQDEFSAMGGVRFNTIDMNTALTSVGYDLKDALTESKRYFSGERSSSQNDPKTVLDARAAANERWKNAFENGMRKVQTARQLGISDQAIRMNLHISGVPPMVIGQLMAGRYSALPLRMPYRQPVDYVGAGTASAGDE